MSHHYKFIILIIDSDGEPCYIKNRTIMRTYLHSYPEVKSFFIRMNDIQTDPVRLDGDVLSFRGTESFYPGILHKTLDAMKYCVDNYSFDYILRTNLSSFWNLPRLLELSLPVTDCIFAPICKKYYFMNSHYDFPSGCGFISSKDVVMKYIQKRDLFVDNVWDDVSFGVFCKRMNIPLSESVKYDFCTDNSIITQNMVNTIVSHGYYHYRVKDQTRIHDNQVFEYLYNAVYNNTSS